MTEHFLGIGDVAKKLGIKQASASEAHLPDPDVMIGRTRGWRPETIDDWIPTRPGKGSGGGRPKKMS